MWAFAVLLILAVGMFPLQAILGLGGSLYDWQICFFVVLVLVDRAHGLLHPRAVTGSC